MEFKEAAEIVLSLAEQNSLPECDYDAEDGEDCPYCDPALRAESFRQHQALNIMREFIAKGLSDGTQDRG